MDFFHHLPGGERKNITAHDLGGVLPEHFCLLITENLLRRGVPVGDPKFGIPFDNPQGRL